MSIVHLSKTIKILRNGKSVSTRVKFARLMTALILAAGGLGGLSGLSGCVSNSVDQTLDVSSGVAGDASIDANVDANANANANATNTDSASDANSKTTAEQSNTTVYGEKLDYGRKRSTKAEVEAAMEELSRKAAVTNGAVPNNSCRNCIYPIICHSFISRNYNTRLSNYLIEFFRS